MEGCFTFQWGGCISDGGGGGSFLSGGGSHHGRALVLMGGRGGVQKKLQDGGRRGAPHAPRTMGNPVNPSHAGASCSY